MITGKSSAGETFSRTLSSGQSTITLPNGGTWNFLAIAWMGATPFTGAPKCAYSKNTVLAGAATEIDLSLKNTTCADATIIDQTSVTFSTDYQFKNTQIHRCLDSVAGMGTSDVCQFAIEQTGGNKDIAPVASAQIGFNDEGFAPATGGGYFSSCQVVDVTFATAAAQWKFPIATADFHLPITVLGYPAAGCTPGTSIEAKAGTSNLNSIASTSHTFFARFPEAELCSAAGTTANSIGLGTAYSPHAICKIEQLKDLQENFASYSAKFLYLLSDLDLMPYVKDTDGGEFHECLESGDTFIPLGYSVSGSPGCTYSAIGPFQGKFHGRGHTVKFFRFKGKHGTPVDDSGFFSILDGAADVGHLKFVHASVQGDDNVGVLAGTTDASSLIRFIEVIDSEVHSEMNYAGGIVGSVGGTLKYSKVKMSVIKGGNHLGGIAGIATASSTLEHVSFDGIVKGNNHDSHTIGGIVGQGVSLKQALSSGLVSGKNALGGLAGKLSSSGMALAYSRSTMAITSPFPQPINLEIGGLVGAFVSSNATIENTFFAGSIVFNCTGTALSCNVGDIYGSATTPVVAATVVSRNSYTGWGGGSGAVVAGATSITSGDLCGGGCAADTWEFPGGDMPRLAKIPGDLTNLTGEENHPCSDTDNLASPATQAAVPLSRGTIENPITLCSSQQVADIVALTDHEDKSYRLLQDILVSDKIMVNDFTGTFFGNRRMLHKDSAVSNAAAWGLFSVNGGIIQDLSLANFRIQTSSGSTNAILAYSNTNSIKNIRIVGSLVQGTSNVGGVAVENSGRIEEVQSYALVQGNSDVGGIVAINQPEGVIKDVDFQGAVSMFDSTQGANKSNFGGIVGHNQGSISKASFEGTLSTLATWSSFTMTKVGAIAGINTGANAIIEDVHVLADAKIQLASVTGEYGAIVGENSTLGTVSRAISEALTILDATSSASGVDTIAGVSTGTVAQYYSRYPLTKAMASPPTFTLTDNTTVWDSGAITWPGGTPATPTSFLLKYQNGGVTEFGYVEGATISGGQFSILNAAFIDGVPTSPNVAEVYTIVVNSDPVPTTVQLKTDGFNLWDETDGDDLTALIDSFKDHLTNTPTTPAVWSKDEEGELKLFRYKD